MIVTDNADPIAPVIFWVTVIFLMAILSRGLAKRINQPVVLCELVIGIVVGNIAYFLGLPLLVVLREGAAIHTIITDILQNLPLSQAVNHAITNYASASQMIAVLTTQHGTNYLKIALILDIFSRFGIVLLLFLVGLESSIGELQQTGRQALQVAIIGVLAPMILGFAMSYLLLPNASYTVDLFLAATLSATSIGITARVLAQTNQLQSREARTILGAAMLDDVLGLMILAIVSNVVMSGHVDWWAIGHLVFITLLFFGLVISIGPILLKKLVTCTQFLTLHEQLLFIPLLMLMVLAWAATVVHLAAIIGAFLAGLLLNDRFFAVNKSSHITIHARISPLESLLAPLFFILMGMQVKLEMFFDWQVIIIALGLIVAAIIGKLLSGLGGYLDDDRWMIGIGMLPRGEVGLVFASIGRTLGVLSDQLFSAIVLMVITTTFITPLLLKRCHR
jgi:Kef-type K+ transport system membrane component KefB